MKKTKPNTLFGETKGKPFKFILDGAVEHTMVVAPTGTGMSFDASSGTGLDDHEMIYAPPRTGMGVGPVIPGLLKFPYKSEN